MTLLSPWRRADGDGDRGGRQSGLGTFHKVRWRRHLGWYCQKWVGMQSGQNQPRGAVGPCDGGDAVAAAGAAVSSGRVDRECGDGQVSAASSLQRACQRGRCGCSDLGKRQCVPISATAFRAGWSSRWSCVARSTGNLVVVAMEILSQIACDGGGVGTSSVFLSLFCVLIAADVALSGWAVYSAIKK